MLVEILTVCVVVYLYLNVVYHLKTSNELAVYDLSTVNKSTIDQMCALRQPFVFKSADDYLCRPPMTVTVKEVVVRDTELQYTNCYRTFIHGQCEVRLACPNAPLRVEKDHLVPKYFTASDASGCSLDVSLGVDDVVFVPAYWWYRVSGTATVVHYKTVMNELATLPDTVLHWLQTQHVVYVPASPKKPLEAPVEGLEKGPPSAPPSAPPPAGGLPGL